MSYTNGKSDNKNCAEHQWPRSGVGGSLRSIGRVTHEQCNNCLAIRLNWESDERINGEWVKVRDSRIVEPNLAP